MVTQPKAKNQNSSKRSIIFIIDLRWLFTMSMTMTSFCLLSLTLSITLLLCRRRRHVMDDIFVENCKLMAHAAVKQKKGNNSVVCK